MPSPFPGMDPYLEDPGIWPDFHAEFISCLRKALNDRLPPGYEARIDERISLVEPATDVESHARPDIALMRRDVPSSPASSSIGSATVEPVTVPLVELEEVRELRIEIRRLPERTLIGVIELLSPANKSGSDRNDYLAERNELLRQPVHLVEIDLLVGGRRVPFARPLPTGDYYAIVARADRRWNSEVYPWSVRRPFPTIPVPLKSPDPDVLIDLGQVFAEAYERGGYRLSIGYHRPPLAPLADADRQWAADLDARKE